MKAVVFGGTGWVGHNIVKFFAEAGYDVTVCSRGQKKNFADDMPGNVSFAQGDKKDPEFVKSVLKDYCSVVVDSVPNVETIDNIAACAANVGRYIHCSSTGGYAPLTFIPGDETMPYDSFEGGWVEKGIVDRKVLTLNIDGVMPCTVIRPCYITGPGMVPLCNLGGRRQDFIADLMNEREIDLPDNGLSLLQPIHVEDLAKSFLLAARTEKSIGQVYNICLEKAVTIKEYVQINASAFGKKAKINFIPLEDMLAKYGDSISETGLRFFATHMCYDISKAKEQLGYRPHISTPDAIIETALWTAKSQGLI